MYGRRKMTRYLRRQGHDVAFCTVDRIMRRLGLSGVVRGRRQRTTIPAKNGIRAADRLNRDFTAIAPNLVWVADFTYVSTWAGWAYVAFVFDAHSRAIVGWTASGSKTTALVSKALNMAVWRRGHYGYPVEPGLIHHSDAGSQYTSVKFTESLALQGLSASIDSVGDAYDNALAESIIGLFKTEVVNRHGPFKTLAEVEVRAYGMGRLVSRFHPDLAGHKIGSVWLMALQHGEAPGSTGITTKINRCRPGASCVVLSVRDHVVQSHPGLRRTPDPPPPHQHWLPLTAPAQQLPSPARARAFTQRRYLQRLAAGFGIGLAIAYRYIRETTDLLAARAPSLTQAVTRLADSFSNYALLDGTVIRIDRFGDRDRLKACYSVKTRHHGITLQVLTDPYGRLAWVSAGLPGSVYDLTAARTYNILDTCRGAGLHLVADRGYIGAGDGVHLPYRRYKNEFTPGRKAANRAHSAIRCLVERGIATLKNWRVLTRVRASPERVTTYARAILTLEQRTRSLGWKRLGTITPACTRAWAT